MQPEDALAYNTPMRERVIGKKSSREVDARPAIVKMDPIVAWIVAGPIAGEMEQNTMGMQRVVLGLAMLMACAATARADRPQPGIVSHVLVLSDKSEDVSSPQAWKKTYIKDGMTDQEKVIAIWKTVVKYRHQDAPPKEGLDEGCVHDPFKTIHVYGYGMCCCAASDVEGLARYLGFDARGWGIHLHSVPEVFYDGSLAHGRRVADELLPHAQRQDRRRGRHPQGDQGVVCGRPGAQGACRQGQRR